MVKNSLIKLLLYIFIIMITIMPISFIRFGIYAKLIPSPELLVIYFTSIYNPISVIYIFLYGILVDEIYGTPIGLEPVLFIASYYFLCKKRVYLLSKPPLSEFLGFIFFIFLYNLFKYLIMHYYFSYNANIIQIFMQIFITILFYLIVYYILKMKNNVK